MVCQRWTSWTSSAISQLLEGKFTNQKSVPGKRKRQGRQIPGEQFLNLKWPPSIGKNSQQQREPAAPETGAGQGRHGEKTETLHTKGGRQQVLCSFSPKRLKNWQQANLVFMFVSLCTVNWSPLKYNYLPPCECRLVGSRYSSFIKDCSLQGMPVNKQNSVSLL